MANKQNLKIPTSKEARENGRKGGIASGEARRKKKLLKECIDCLLEEDVEENGKTMSGAEALAVKLFEEARNGNVKAFEVLRDTAGQKPAEKVVVSNIDPDVIAQVERMVNSETD